MAASNKKWLLLGVAALIIAVAATVVFIKEKQRVKAEEELRAKTEAQWRQDVDDFLAGLPGEFKVESVDVSPETRSVTLHNFSGNLQLFPDAPLTFSATKLVLEGINRNALEKPGVVQLVEKVRTDGFSMDASANPAAWLDIVRGSDTTSLINGVWADTWALRRIVGKDWKSKEFDQAIASLRFGPATSEKGVFRLAGNNPSPDIPASPFTMTYDIIEELDPYTMYTLGRAGGKNISILYDNGSAITIGAFTSDAISVSPQIREMTNREFAEPEEMLGFFGKLMEDGIVNKNMQFTDVLITPVKGLAIIVPAFSFDMNLGNGNMMLKTRADSIQIPSTTLQILGLDFDNTGRDWDFRFVFDLETTPNPDKNNLLDITLHHEFSEAQLTKSTLDLHLTGRAMTIPDALPFDVTSLALVSATSELHDTGIGDTIIGSPAFMPPEAAGKDAIPHLRQLLADELLTNVPGFPKSLQPMMERYADLIAQGGELRLSLIPSTPQAVLSLFMNLDNPDVVNIQATHTPLGAVSK